MARLEKWERPTLLNLMIIIWSISYTIHGSVATYETANEDLDVIGQNIKESNKAEIENCISSFKMPDINLGGIKNYISIVDIITTLKELNVPLTYDL